MIKQEKDCHIITSCETVKTIFGFNLKAREERYSNVNKNIDDVE